MSNAQDTALAFILNEYAKQIDALRPAPELKLPAPGKLPTIRQKKGKAPANVVKATAPTFAYTVGSVDATGFMSLLKTCGMRPNAHGVNVCHPALVKGDEVEAINAFIGYDYKQNHGTQIDAARRRAHLALHNALGHRSAKNTVAGYVKGMPSGKDRTIADLLGREKLAAETLCQYENVIQETIKALTDPYISTHQQTELQAQRSLHQGLCMVERERIAAIREELARMR